MNSLPLSPLVICFILRDIYWENYFLQILRNTEVLNSYQGLSRPRPTQGKGKRRLKFRLDLSQPALFSIVILG